jgi:hypothetical protein
VSDVPPLQQVADTAVGSDKPVVGTINKVAARSYLSWLRRLMGCNANAPANKFLLVVSQYRIS